MIKILLVDDEFPSLKILENFAQKMPECTIVGKCTSGEEALGFLQENAVDVLFLDIQMPGITGLELLGKLEVRPVTVITTANHGKALDAYNLGVVDYLAKPFSFERFQQALERAKAQLSYSLPEQKDLLEKPNFITVKSDYKVVKILLSEIKYIAGYGEYVKIVMTKNHVITLEALKNLVSILPKEDFVRIHKSYIVNVKFVRTITSTYVVLNDGQQIPIGKVYKDAVRAKFK